MSRLDFIEREARANMEFHLKNLDALKKEAQDTLKILFLILSAGSGYTVKLFAEGDFSWGFVFGFVTVYLICVAIYLTLRCLAAGDVMPPSNEPKNLSSRDYTLDQLREEDLKRLQRGIDFNQARNETLGQRLNNSRILICCSPIALVFAWFLNHAINLYFGLQTF